MGSDYDYQWFSSQQHPVLNLSGKTQNLISLVVKDNEFVVDSLSIVSSVTIMIKKIKTKRNLPSYGRKY